MKPEWKQVFAGLCEEELQYARGGGEEYRLCGRGRVVQHPANDLHVSSISLLWMGRKLNTRFVSFIVIFFLMQVFRLLRHSHNYYWVQGPRLYTSELPKI